MFICPRCAERSRDAGACDRDGAERIDCDGDDLLGRKAGNFRLCARIAGSVYRAANANTGGAAAVKVLPGADDAERFLAHARRVNQLGHAGLARSHDMGAFGDGRPWLLMELLDGETLEARRRAGLLPIDEVLRIGRALRAILDAAHAAGVALGGIAADHVIVGDDGEVKVLGFAGGAAEATAAADREALARLVGDALAGRCAVPEDLGPPRPAVDAPTVAFPTAVMTVRQAPLIAPRSGRSTRIVVGMVIAAIAIVLAALVGWIASASAGR